MTFFFSLQWKKPFLERLFLILPNFLKRGVKFTYQNRWATLDETNLQSEPLKKAQNV
ncbi:MAG: hypothetical protein RLZZ628_464 [Bacteroidota bacterium]|jgi:hypothetical protein